MRSTATNLSWADANQRVLMGELALVREGLLQHSEMDRESSENSTTASINAIQSLRLALDEARAALSAPSALDQVTALFGLSPFERAILLLCAGMELDSAFAAQCAVAQGDRQRPHPTFSLALAALSEPHWSAMTPNAPLRHWRLIEVGSGPAVTTNPLRIDERILHFLAGVPGMDERLIGFLEPVVGAETLAPTHQVLADQVACHWLRPAQAVLPVVQLCGRDAASKRHLAAATCASLGLNLWCLSAERLPQTVAELEMLQRLWEREAALNGGALLLDCVTTDGGETGRQQTIRHWIERTHGPLLVSTVEPLQGILHLCVNLEVRKPTSGEQRELWARTLEPVAAALNGQVDRLVSQFDLNAASIRAVCSDVLDRVRNPGQLPSSSIDPQSVWDTCRSQSRVKLDDLAQRVHSAVKWEDLVLPERSMALLREIGIHVRQRARVYEAWGFAAKSSRGLGISAMFCGPSGTGKTLAAEVLANELGLDLYRIDLSQVVSKYIGETEKNLRRVFDAAEEGGAVLLFDEADALFGKRSEVKDSHDRYANIEVSYLLQRMEAYRGLAILTTNMKEAVDSAFLRRIRFVVQFPFPDAALRAEIWRRVFPRETPTEGLQPARLARLNVAGGNIRNMAMSAAFIAAEAGEPVRIGHLVRAARSEFAKLEKPLSEAELEGWK